MSRYGGQAFVEDQYEFVDVARTPLSGPPAADERLSASTATWPRWPALSAARRRLLLGLAVVVVAVAAAVQLMNLPVAAPVPVPAAPLVARECQYGTCRVEFTLAAQLTSVHRALDEAYIVNGQRTRDPRGVLRQIQVIASDGVHVLTVRAARIDRVPTSWAAPMNHTTRDSFEWTVTRSVVIRQDGEARARWLVEVRTGGPVGSSDLLHAATTLSSDAALVT